MKPYDIFGGVNHKTSNSEALKFWDGYSKDWVERVPAGLDLRTDRRRGLVFLLLALQCPAYSRLGTRRVLKNPIREMDRTYPHFFFPR